MQTETTDAIEQQRENFSQWLIKNKLSLRAVATAAGMTESPLRFYKNGKTRDLRHENKMRIARAFNTTIAEIFGDASGITETTPALQSTDRHAIPMTVPVMARVDNEELRETNHPVSFIEAPAGMVLSGNVYAVRTPNTSMIPRFRPFEVLLCEPDPQVGAGDDCAVHIQNGYIHILRCLVHGQSGDFTGTTYAQPDTEIQIPGKDITKISRIVGLLMGV